MKKMDLMKAKRNIKKKKIRKRNDLELIKNKKLNDKVQTEFIHKIKDEI